jgi:hypothetical protein
MLIAKGYRAGFRLVGKKTIFAPPRGAAMLHDPSGRDWPRCSVLFASFSRSGSSLGRSNPTAVEYFGYDPKAGSLTVPPKTLSDWKYLGEVEYIRYDRPGTKYKGRYDHHFKGTGWFGFKSSFPRLYRRGRVYRLDLGSGCDISWRGFVFP